MTARGPPAPLAVEHPQNVPQNARNPLEAAQALAPEDPLSGAGLAPVLGAGLFNASGPLINASGDGAGTGNITVNVTFEDCFANYAFGEVNLGEVHTRATVDFSLDNISHHDAEVRECVDFNPTYNGELYLACVDGTLNATNTSCYLDTFPPVLTRVEVGTPWPVFGPTNNETKWVNLTTPEADTEEESQAYTAPWDQFILMFNEAVQAGAGTITITEINPPEARRDYRGDVIELPVDDYYKVFLGEGEGPWAGLGVAVIKAGQDLPTKNGGQAYEMHVPSGAFLDRAGNPCLFTRDLPLHSPEYNGFPHGNMTSFANVTGQAWVTPDLTFQFIVADRIAPHVVMDWVSAFYPMHGDQGRYITNNITITFDEPLILQGNATATIRLEPRLPDDVLCYGEFQIHGCGAVYLDEDHQTLVFPLYGPGVELSADMLQLHIYPRRQGYELEHGTIYAVVIDKGDIADAAGLNFTGLGTLEQGNYYFMTATEEQLELREKMRFLADYDERRLIDTFHMFHATSVGDLPWKDSAAKMRAITLAWAIGEARKILADPYGLPVKLDLETMVANLLVHRIEPRGTPFSEEWTCSDLQSHMLSTVDFTCSSAAQKTGTGFDVATRTGTFYYRDGCLCRSKFMNHCPFKLASSSPYTRFGFDGMEEKVVGGSDALCWYWSAPLFPEHGYLSSPSAFFNGTDPADDDRLLKQFWSWHAAHRPTEAAAANMKDDHYALTHAGTSRRTMLRRDKTVTVPEGPPPPPKALRGFRLRVPRASKASSVPFEQVDRDARVREASDGAGPVVLGGMVATPPPEPVGWPDGNFPTVYPPVLTTPAPPVPAPLSALPTFAPQVGPDTPLVSMANAMRRWMDPGVDR